MSSTASDELSNQATNDQAAKGMQAMMQHQRLIAEANSAYGLLCKKLKSDGLDVPALKQAIKLNKQDRVFAIGTIKATLRYSGLLGIPVTPESLFDGMDFAVSEQTQNDMDVWTATERGYEAGKAGHKIETDPYQPGSEQSAEWRRFWHKGQEALVMAKGPNATEIRATPGRRARQPKLPIETPMKVAAVKKAVGRPRKKAAPVRRPRRPSATGDGASIY